MILKHNHLPTSGTGGQGFAPTGGGSGRSLVAVAPDGRMAMEPCAPLPFGDVRDGIRLVLEASQAIRISLTDPEGDFMAPPEPFSSARLDLGHGDSASTQQVSLASSGNRAELAFWRDRIPQAEDGTSGGALLIAGYEPVPLDLTNAPAELERTLQRRAAVPVTVDVSGSGAPFVESLALRVVYVPEGQAPPPALAFEVIDGWWLRGDCREGVAPGETVELLARPGERGFLQVTLSCVYGSLTSIAPILELGGSDDGHRVEIVAPDWEPQGAGRPGDDPLTYSRNAVVLVDLVDEVTGEPIPAWSFRAESSGRNFKGKVDYPHQARRFGAFPGLASLRFEARGYAAMELGPIQFDPGGKVDLGQVSMTRQEGLRVALLWPDGTPASGRSIRVPEQALQGLDLSPDVRTEIDVAPGGKFVLDHALAGVDRVLLTQGSWNRWYTCQVIALEPAEGGGRRGTVRRWQPVRFRLSGLSGPSLYDRSHLVVTDAAGLCPVAPTVPEASSTTQAFHWLSVPPGRWVVAPAPSGGVTFDPLEFEVAVLNDPEQPTVIDIEAAPAH